MTPISEGHRARFYLYKSKKDCKTFIYIYTQIARHFAKKARQFTLRFYSQKARHFTLRDFSWFYGNWYLFKQKVWKFLLRDVFIYKNPDTSKKGRQFELRFLYTKSLTLCVTWFSWSFWTWRRGGAFIYIYKQCTLPSIFIYKKQCTLRYVFIYKKPDTLCHTFTSKK